MAFDNDKYNIGIVGLIFEPQSAYLNALLATAVPQSVLGEYLQFSHKGIKIHPNGFGVDEIQLELQKMLPLPWR
ncbi:MAG: hypothetical protein IPL65_19650 [Lewinellaceae bacterium]|nr:hypothetical protein [Lewinellaceae bacterium]